MKLKMRAQQRLLDEAQLARLLHKALYVWREVPFRVQGTDEFYDYLSDYGCLLLSTIAPRSRGPGTRRI